MEFETIQQNFLIFMMGGAAITDQTQQKWKVLWKKNSSISPLCFSLEARARLYPCRLYDLV